MRSDIGDVGYPNCIRRADIKLSVQCISRNHCWRAAVFTKTPFVANLCFDACLTGQTRHPVLGTQLALIAQIICQFTITIDLAAVSPRLLDQSRLARILKRTEA